VRLRELELRRLPGIDAGFALREEHVCAAVNVIHGPNGSGKSSLCRAVRALLWPDAERPASASLRARLEHGGVELSVERDGARTRWQREGSPAPPPALPAAQYAACYTIGLDDLVAGRDDLRQAMAGEIVRQMSGGYDLAGVREALFERRPKLGEAEARALRASRARLGEVQREQERLSREEAQLESLRRDLARAQEAGARAKQLDRALEHRAALRLAAHAQSELEGVPPAMERLREDESERLEELEGSLAKDRASRAEVQRSEREAEEARSAARLDEVLGEALLSEQRERLESLRHSGRRIQELREEDQGALEQLEQRRRVFGPGADLERLLAADGNLLAGVEGFMHRADDLRLRRSALELEIARAESADAGDVESLREACTALLHWLRAPERSQSSRNFWVYGSLSAATVAAAIVLALVVHPAWILLGLAPLAAWLGLGRAAVAAGDAMRSAAEADFARTGQAPPAAWTASEVERRLAELSHSRGEAELASAQRAALPDLRQRWIELETAERGLEREREALRSAIGAPAAVADLRASVLAASLVALQEAHARRGVLRAKLESAERDETRAAGELQRFLAAYGEPCSADAASLSRGLSALVERNAALDGALRELSGLRRTREMALSRIDGLERQRAQLFERAGLEVGDAAGLQERLARLPAWKDLRGRLDEARRKAAEVALELETSQELLDSSEQELHTQRAECEELSRRAEDWIAAIASTRRGIEDAARAGKLEEATAVCQRAREELEDKRAGALAAAAGRALLEQVEREHTRTSQPRVLRRAKELFELFTQRRYELLVEAGDGRVATFRARDTSTRRGLALEELSSGTRTQLLLAVRIAFAAEAERGEPLPLFLDEALTTADPERFEAVARSLVALARAEGRQIFYLTSQPQDAQPWRRIANGEDELRCIDLDALRRGQDALREVALLAPPASELPDPLACTPAEYRERIRLPRLDPRCDVDGLHLGYLLEHELELLGSLLAGKIETLGRLRLLARSGNSRAYIGERDLERVEAWAQLTQVLLEAWRIGRGRPLEREALERCGAVTDVFLERVWELAVRLGGDSKALLAALETGEVKRFHSRKIEELARFLELERYLDPSEVLAEEAVYDRVLKAAAPAVGAGLIEASDVRRRFEWLWNLCNAAAPGAKESA
jgi:exonuclease SbcC